MAESADKTSADSAGLDESSEVVELTEEVAAEEADESTDSQSDESVEVKEGGDAEEYDRQAMVKTVQMQAVDRKAVEGMIPDDSAAAKAAILADARFSPEVIPGPPAVLVKKWRDGLPGKVERIVGEPRQQEQQSEIPPEPDTEVMASPAPEADTEEMPVDQMPDVPAEEPSEKQVDVSETAELDESDIEELDTVDLKEKEEDQRPRKSTPPPTQPPPSKQEPSEKKKEAKPAAKKGGDDDMSGLVQELLEEEKQKKEKQQLGPRQTWFKQVFGEEYLRSVPENIAALTQREADFIEKSLRLKKNSRILDLACGFGRHSLELASRGYEMVGLDLSMDLLQKGLDAAQQKSLNVKLIHGDMRELGFSQVFDGCFIWNTSLGYFDDRTNLGVLHGLHKALKVGGRLLIDVINRDHVVHQTPTRLWWEGKGCIFLEETEFNHQTSTLEAQRSYIYEDGTPPVEHTSYIRLYSVHELRQMLHVAGFKVREVSGDYHYKGHFLGASSPRIIILAEKRKKKRRPSRANRSGANKK